MKQKKTDGMEVNTQGTNPLLKDTDNDGLSDYDEVMIYGTNPNDADSDNDGLSDGFEVQNGFDPLVSSTELGDPLAVSPGCEAYMNNEVYTTTIEAAVNFVYEVAIDSTNGGSIDEVNNDMENKLAKLVGRELIKCELDDVDDILKRNRRRLPYNNAIEQHQHQQQHRHLLVDGVNPTPKDIVLTQQTCTYYTTDNSETPSNSNCYVIQGFMTLYLRENYPQSSTLQSSQLALRTLLNSMNTDDPSPFLEDSGDEDVSVDGVVGVRYIKGTPDAGGIKLIDNKGGSGVNGNVDGLAEGGDDTSSGMLDPLSPVGITLIVLGSVGIIAVALVAARSVRKRKQPKAGSSEYAEFYDDDDDDLDMKHRGWYGEEAEAETDRDAASLNASPSPKKKSRQFHYGEDEDSIFSGLDQTSPGTNVSEPAFVHTRNNNQDGGRSIDGMTTEQGYEAGIQFYPEQDPFPRTQYEPKVSVESPRYENPAGIQDKGGRVYSVGDTVEF